jgi:hypothetical protein
MRRRFHTTAIIALAMLSSAPARAQTAIDKPPRLTLGAASGAPGTPLVVPIYFAPAGVAIGALEFETTFVSRNLKFQRFASGSAAENAGTQVTSSAEEKKDDKGLEHTTLRVKFTAPPGNESAATVPAGLLGYIQTRVNETAGPAIISFRSTVKATLATDPTKAQDVEIIDDQVEIIAAGSEPLISCFFFTH